MSNEYQAAYAQKIVEATIEVNRKAKEEIITKWRALGIEPRDDGRKGVWVPDWAEALEREAAGRMDIFYPPYNVDPVDLAGDEMTRLRTTFNRAELWKLIPFLAEDCPDAAEVIFAARGLPGLIAFARETKELHDEEQRRENAANAMRLSKPTAEEQDPAVEAFGEELAELEVSEIKLLPEARDGD